MSTNKQECILLLHLATMVLSCLANDYFKEWRTLKLLLSCKTSGQPEFISFFQLISTQWGVAHIVAMTCKRYIGNMFKQLVLHHMDIHVHTKWMWLIQCTTEEWVWLAMHGQGSPCLHWQRWRSLPLQEWLQKMSPYLTRAQGHAPEPNRIRKKKNTDNLQRTQAIQI